MEQKLFVNTLRAASRSYGSGTDSLAVEVNEKLSDGTWYEYIDQDIDVDQSERGDELIKNLPENSGDIKLTQYQEVQIKVTSLSGNSVALNVSIPVAGSSMKLPVYYGNVKIGDTDSWNSGETYYVYVLKCLAQEKGKIELTLKSSESGYKGKVIMINRNLFRLG